MLKIDALPNINRITFDARGNADNLRDLQLALESGSEVEIFGTTGRLQSLKIDDDPTFGRRNVTIVFQSLPAHLRD